MQDLVSIRAFHALYKHQSLTSAAKYLNQPKSTLSRRITQLENDVGHSLVTRQGNKLVITKAGEIFFEYCEKLMTLSDENAFALQHLNNRVSGELFIVANNGLIRGWLSQMIDEFLEENPDVSIRLVSQYHENASDVQPDLILWIGRIDGLKWRKETLGHWYCSVYASPQYIANNPELDHPRDLKDHRWVDFAETGQNGHWLMHPDEESFYFERPISRLKSDNSVLQLDAIVKGRGIGLMPVGMVAKFNQAHPSQLISCLPGWYTQPLEICAYTPQGRQPQKVTAFLHKIKEHRPTHWLKMTKTDL
ncbi:LysR family transcriptional regulator [Vibrio sp.]|nr:LysR family transcriptional regulator [Vibrio sp.]